MQLEVRLLGDVALLVDGQPLDLGGTRQRSVFALLVLQRDRPISTELLADRLWPDEQPLSAIKTIQVYVSRIRRVLGGEAGRLASTATGYRFAITDDELDAARFERGLRKAREALASGSLAATASGFEAALAEWSGPALGDLAGEQFARREADRLEELRLQAFEELYELRVAAGQARATIGDLRRLVAEQPGRERLWRLLMLALYHDGRQSEALETYHDARRYLADELGLDPSPELAELERAILTQEAVQPAPVQLFAAVTEPPAGPDVRRTRRVVTVLRADVVRATGDEVDPELREALDRRALDVVRRAVERHGGTIDRTDHDGVTAVFGLTVAREDDALRAVRAADELREVTPDAVTFRIGVATDEVVAGPPAGVAPALTGAPLKVAAQLAAQAAPLTVLLSDGTAALVRGAVSTKPHSRGRDDDMTAASAVRLVALTDDDAIVRRTTTPFVGRAAELNNLVASFERVVANGAPGLVTVVGAPGVGKSRLVAEALARIAERATILRSRCLPYGDGITYWPVRELVLKAADIESGESRTDALRKLDAVVAGSDQADLVLDRVAAVVGMSDVPAPDEEIRWAVRRYCEAIAAARPLVLLVDDLQWAEPVLVELLDHILDLGRGPMLLVTIARPEIEEAHPGWLTRPTLGLTRLEAFDQSEAGILLDQLAPELPAGPLRSRILAAAEGNPLFVEQFVAYAFDQVDAHGRVLDEQAARELPIPPTIGALLAARLDRLPDVERRLLERAAVIGRTFYGGALAELLPDGDRAEVPRRLARLARRDLIRPDRADVPDDEAYRFRHLLIRDAAYASVPKDERAELHETFANWLAARSTTDSDQYDLVVGYHLEQAYRYRTELDHDPATARLLADRALALIAPAGQAALERGDPHAAISLLRRAINLAPPGGQRIELLIDLRAALRTAGEREASDAADAEVLALLARYPDEGLEYRRWLNEAGFYIAGPPTPTIAQAEEAFAYYQRVGDAMGRLRALGLAIAIHSVDGRFSDSLDLLDRALDLAFEIRRPDRAAALFLPAAWSLTEGPVPVSDAAARLRRYLGSAGSNRSALAAMLLCLGRLEAMAGADDWRRHFDAAKAIIDDFGLREPFGAFVYPNILGITESAVGDPARAVAILQDSCSTLDRHGDRSAGLASMAPLTAQALLGAGRLDEVERYAFWGRDLATPDDIDAQVRWRLAVSGLRSAQGQHDEAIALARAAEACTVGSEYVVLRQESDLSLAVALRAAGDEAGAIDAALEAQHLASAKQDRATLRKIEGFLHAGNSGDSGHPIALAGEPRTR